MMNREGEVGKELEMEEKMAGWVTFIDIPEESSELTEPG